MRGRLKIFSTRSLSSYRKEVVAALGAYGPLPYQQNAQDVDGELTVSRFADGEMEAEIGTSVRGCDVFLFAGGARGLSGISSEENKLETYHAVDALRRAQAQRVTLFEPYCSPGRSDRLTRRNSVGLWLHFKILISLGINHYVTFQLHSEKSKTFIDPTLCVVDDIPAQALLKTYLCDRVIVSRARLHGEVRNNWLFSSVDAGGEALAKRFAASFGTRIVISHKQRDYSTANTVESINILTSDPIEGKVVWIIDDMIDTGDSVYKLVKELAKREPAEINIAIVHAIFSPPALDRIGELCDRRLLGTILVTDTVPCTQDLLKRLPCMRVVPSTAMAAEIVYRLTTEQPMSPLLAQFNADDYLKE
ncbi:MAG TPA: ribose-phosphate diphosphokinase [Spirochaetia bacterium]|nr:ribose-phosphate diphosphokinase [Spirochaetia bacterium]